MVELWNCQACKRNFGPSKLAKLAGPGGQPAGLIAPPVTKEFEERIQKAWPEDEVLLEEIFGCRAAATASSACCDQPIVIPGPRRLIKLKRKAEDAGAEQARKRPAS